MVMDIASPTGLGVAYMTKRASLEKKVYSVP